MKVSSVGIGASSPYSAPPVEVKTRGAPTRRAASSRLRVPCTLTSQSRCGCLTDIVTDAWAARW